VDGGDGETERERLGVGGMSDVSGVGGADLGRENEGHRLLARLVATGIAARRSRGEMVLERESLQEKERARARQRREGR
jgi:hypothetical protein